MECEEVLFIRNMLSLLSGNTVAFPIVRTQQRPHSISTGVDLNDSGAAHQEEETNANHIHQFLVKTLKHTQHELNFDQRRTIAEFKDALYELCHILPEQQRIIWRGKALNNEMIIMDVIKNIQQEPNPIVLHLVERHIPASKQDTIPDQTSTTEQTATEASSTAIGVAILTTSSTTPGFIHNISSSSTQGASDGSFDHSAFKNMLESYLGLHSCTDPECHDRIHAFIQHFNQSRP